MRDIAEANAKTRPFRLPLKPRPLDICVHEQLVGNPTRLQICETSSSLLMNPPSSIIRNLRTLRPAKCFHRRRLMTLAIETSCDDTSVAILETNEAQTSLHFHAKITSDNRDHHGVHPIVALDSHQSNLAKLIRHSLSSLPIQRSEISHLSNALLVADKHGTQIRKKPDFITVTRGPGMQASLAAGLDTAKGLAVAWQIPLLGVNHMQAHALTSRLVSALDGESVPDPKFPFLSLLVSGGHTMLVQSTGLCNHKILANTSDIAIGDFIDKFARDLLPTDVLEEIRDVMYGRTLETYAFPNGAEDHDYVAPKTRKEELASKLTEHGWALTPPLAETKGGQKVKSFEYSFTGLGSSIKRIMAASPNMSETERILLAKEGMRVAFEHLVSRLLMALQLPELQKIETIVVSGGVASNQYLKTILRKMLNQKGYDKVRILFPPPDLCTDNAAMIAWTGMEMWNAGWRSDLSCSALRKWSIDPAKKDGIMGVDWLERGSNT